MSWMTHELLDQIKELSERTRKALGPADGGFRELRIGALLLSCPMRTGPLVAQSEYHIFVRFVKNGEDPGGRVLSESGGEIMSYDEDLVVAALDVLRRHQVLDVLADI